VDAQFQQILIDGFFHADPHPGNSFALDGNVLCFCDFGMVGYLDHGQRRELISCFVAFANKDMEKFLAHFLHIAEPSRTSDIVGFKKDASEVLNEMFFSPTNPSVAWVFFRLMHRGAKRSIFFPADLALFSKSLITTEAMGLGLYPDFEFDRHLTPFIKKAFEAYIDPGHLHQSLANDLIDYAALLHDIPRRIDAALKSFDNQAGLRLKLDEGEVKLLQREMGRYTERRLAEISLLAAALLFAVVLVMQGSAALLYPVAYVVIGFFLAISLTFAWGSRKAN
jgi:ubiquinone biosynthesis protein